MFGVPSARAGDWNFQLVGFPVRVSIWFWLMAVILGPHEPRSVIIWVACVFVSILVHEMGHGVVARWFGHRPRIMLYEFGGLCAYEPDRATSNQRIAILAGGPLAQFLLLAIVAVVGALFMEISFYEDTILARRYLGIPTTEQADVAPHVTETAREVFEYLFIINWLWPLLNLLPIWPLDGGQITGEVLHKINRRDGRRWGHIVSMITAGVIALYTLAYSTDESMYRLLRVMFFASFAFANYRILQSYHRDYQVYGSDRDDW